MNDISEKACSVDIYLIRFSEYDLLPFSLDFFVYVWMPVYIPVFFEVGKTMRVNLSKTEITHLWVAFDKPLML